MKKSLPHQPRDCQGQAFKAAPYSLPVLLFSYLQTVLDALVFLLYITVQHNCPYPADKPVPVPFSVPSLIPPSPLEFFPECGKPFQIKGIGIRRLSSENWPLRPSRPSADADVHVAVPGAL